MPILNLLQCAHELIYSIRCTYCCLYWNCSKRVCASKFVQCIGATTLDEYRKHIEKDPALERRFQPVKVPEPTVDETIQILKGLRERYEIHHKLRYTDDALVAAAQLSYQYIRFAIIFFTFSVDFSFSFILHQTRFF